MFRAETGLVQQNLWGRLTRRVTLEYLVLSAAAVAFILLAFRWA